MEEKKRKVITEDDVIAQGGELKPDKPVDEQIMLPGKYEVTPEHTFRVNLFVEQVENRWVVREKMNKNCEHHWVEFRMWTFAEEIELRKLATTYDPLKRLHFVDHDMLNRLKVQRLMKEWTFQNENERLHLHHVNGVLTDECYKNFQGLFANIVRAIIEGMNGVLEYNG